MKTDKIKPIGDHKPVTDTPTNYPWLNFDVMHIQFKFVSIIL